MSAPVLVRINHAVRTAAFAYSLLVIGVHLAERAPGPAVWALAALQFLAYPHLAYWRALRSPRPVAAEIDNLYLDAALAGLWVAFLGFPTWIALMLVGSAMLNAAINRGARGVGLALAASAAGAGLWALLGGFDYAPQTGPAVTALCLAGALLYASVVGVLMHRALRRLSAARNELARTEERYRLIAENAADLIALVDHEGHWLYTSPSYAAVLPEADLAAGGDAFRRTHPDDAQAARLAVLRAASGARPGEVTLRLVDRAGRMRQYRMRAQGIGEGERVLLVSHDVTDLRESEERVLLAAHALEGMTEAIMITSAEGTVVTVNRAFSEITGYNRNDVLGQPEKTVRNALQPPEFYEHMYATVQREGHWSGTTWSRRKNGSVYREWRSVRAVRDAAGRITHYVFVFYQVGSSRGHAQTESGT